MSNPVTNVEIEDVLSSIRRLVSDESRPAFRSAQPKDQAPQDAVESDADSETAVYVQRAPVAEEHVPEEHVDEPSQLQATAPEHSEPTVPQSPALILTPALRVETDAETGNADEEAEAFVLESEHIAEIPEEWNAEPDHETSDASENAGSGEQGWQSQEPLEAPETDPEEAREVVPQMPVQAEEETAETVAFEIERDRQETMPEPNEASLEEVDVHGAPEGADRALEQDSPAAENLSIEAKIAALEALIGGNDEFEPDGAEAIDVAESNVQSLPWRDTDEPVRRAAAEPAMPEPDAPSQDAHFDVTGLSFRQAHAEAAKEVAEEIEANISDAFGGETGAYLDEDALRDMVADIVRQELQGPLGERITRNVRKLVRREIYRALAANELD